MTTTDRIASEPASQRASTSARIVLGLAGSVLIAAAVLKLSGSSVSAFAQYGWWLSANVQIAAIGWELLLGVALILGVHRPVTWLLALITFGLFAGISGYLGIIGQANCGCFGSIEASPWAAFTVDATLLLLLTLFRPRFITDEFRSSAIESGKWALGLAMVLAVVLGAGVILYGSPAGALAQLRGDALSVDRTHVDFGQGKPGDILTQHVTITNWTEGPLRIIGGTSDCSCVTTVDLPLTFSSRESKKVTISYRVPRTDQPGIISRTAILLTDVPKQPELVLTLSASVD